MAKVVCYVLSPKELPLAGKSFLEKDKLFLKRRFEETNSLRDMNVNECRQKLRLLIDETIGGAAILQADIQLVKSTNPSSTERRTAFTGDCKLPTPAIVDCEFFTFLNVTQGVEP